MTNLLDISCSDWQQELTISKIGNRSLFVQLISLIRLAYRIQDLEPTGLFSGDNRLLFVYLPFHMQQPLRADLRPPTTKLLETLKSEQDCFKRIIIAFSKAPNISDFCKKNRLEAQIDTRQIR